MSHDLTCFLGTIESQGKKGRAGTLNIRSKKGRSLVIKGDTLAQKRSERWGEARHRGGWKGDRDLSNSKTGSLAR